MKNNFKLYVILNLLLIILLFIISIGYSLLPQIMLNGKSNIVLKLNDKYEDEGIVTRNLFGQKKYNVSIKNNLNVKKVGKYEIEYIINLKFFNIKNKRIIEVKDTTKPEITLVGEDTVSVCPESEYEELGYNATDNYDGDITKKVQVIKSKDSIKYKVKDSSNNVFIKVRNLVYEDKTAPTLTLQGGSNISIEKNTNYVEPGYSAVDNCDGDITSSVTVSGNVDTNNSGTYTLTYSITDKNNNTTTLTRNVNVYTKTYTVIPNGPIIYLTFDDGPSSTVTSQMLDILKDEGVKATFFVINHSDSLNYLIKREYDEGHTVALHSYTHNYSTVYSSVDAYFNDLYLISNKVKGIIGEEVKIIRFPGGSSNTVSRHYSSGIMSTLVNEVANRGYTYFDWNVSSGDAGDVNTSSEVYNSVIKGLSKKRPNVVLMHDYENNYKTLNALRNIIRYGKDNGYNFERLTTSSYQAKQKVNN